MMSFIRSVVELLSRGKVIERHIIVNGDRIPLLVTPDAQLKYIKIGMNAFDKDLINMAERFLSSGSNVWDIGANIGVFTFAASAVAYNGMILAVEPDTWLVEILRKSAKLKINKDKDIRVLPAAISETNSVAEFLIAKRGRASNALKVAAGRSQMGGIREKQYVPTLTLDNLLHAFPKPDFIKMDVEGAELLALKGGENIIKYVRPLFYIEIGDNVTDQIEKIFRKESYRMFDGQKLRTIRKCIFNTLFVPEEKCDKFFDFKDSVS